LGWSLSLSQDHLRHPAAQRTVMIYLGKSQVFEGQMAQALDGLVRRKRASADLVEEFADGISVQGHSAVSYQHSANVSLD
jgi:hypothetical protein